MPVLVPPQVFEFFTNGRIGAAIDVVDDLYRFALVDGSQRLCDSAAILVIGDDEPKAC
jgi:hypothetical protein